MRDELLGDVRRVIDGFFVLHAYAVVVDRHFGMRYELAVLELGGIKLDVVSLPCPRFERSICLWCVDSIY